MPLGVEHKAKAEEDAKKAGGVGSFDAVRR